MNISDISVSKLNLIHDDFCQRIGVQRRDSVTIQVAPLRELEGSVIEFYSSISMPPRPLKRSDLEQCTSLTLSDDDANNVRIILIPERHPDESSLSFCMLVQLSHIYLGHYGAKYFDCKLDRFQELGLIFYKDVTANHLVLSACEQRLPVQNLPMDSFLEDLIDDHAAGMPFMVCVSRVSSLLAAVAASEGFDKKTFAFSFKRRSWFPSMAAALDRLLALTLKFVGSSSDWPDIRDVDQCGHDLMAVSKSIRYPYSGASYA